MMRPRRSQFRAASDRSASVLVIVLCVCLGLVAVALTFGHSMSMNYRGSDNDLAGHEAQQAIEGAVRYAESVLSNVQTPGLFPDRDSYLAEAQVVGNATFWFIGRPDEGDYTSEPVFGLVDEGSKLNLNLPNLTAAMLEALPGMTPDLASAIMEWRGGGNSAGVSFNTVKGGNFESIEELALVEGFDSTLLYGEDANLNGALEPSEDDGETSLPSDNSNGKLEPGILEYVTVFSREPSPAASQSNGTSRVSVNPPTAANTALSQLLTSQLTSNGATYFTNLTTGAAANGVTDIRSDLEFIFLSKITDADFAQIADQITMVPPPTTPGAAVPSYIPGRVNVNTASASILECIPGLTGNGTAIVTERKNRTTSDTSIAWLISSNLISSYQQARDAGPFITGKSYQARVDVAAVGHHGRGYRRNMFIIDTSDSDAGPRVVYRRNLGPLGWALGPTVRQSLAQTNTY